MNARTPSDIQGIEGRKTVLTPERKFLQAKAKLKYFLGEQPVKKYAVYLRGAPQAEGKQNPHLAARNQALKQFKIRAINGTSAAQQELRALLNEAQHIAEQYKTSKGKSVEESSTGEIVERVKEASEKTLEEVTAPSVSPDELRKRMENTTAKIERGMDILERFKEEVSWQRNLAVLQQLQTLREPFPAEFGLSKELQMETEAAPKTQPFVQQNFSKPEEIGRGSFSNVYSSTKKRTEKVALKMVRQDRKRDALLEYEMLQGGQQAPESLVLPTAVYEAKGKLKGEGRIQPGDIIIEYPLREGKDARAFLASIRHVDPQLKQRQVEQGKIEFLPQLQQVERKIAALEIVQQIARGLDWAQENMRLIHRDVNPVNVIVQEEQEGGERRPKAALIDFGEAMYDGEVSETVAGSPTYMPPEIFQGEHKGKVTIDIYALGVMLYVLLTDKEDPFDTKAIINSILIEEAARYGKQLKSGDITDEMRAEENLTPEQKTELGLQVQIRKEAAYRLRSKKSENPFHEDNLRESIYEPSSELIDLIQKATEGEVEQRTQNYYELLRLINKALAAEGSQREKLKAAMKREERSRKASDKYRRSAVQEEQQPKKETPAPLPQGKKKKTVSFSQGESSKDERKRRRDFYWNLEENGDDKQSA